MLEKVVPQIDDAALVLLDFEPDDDDTILCDSAQRPANRHTPHPATWVATLDECFHRVYGCDVAYRRWAERTAGAMLDGGRRAIWNCTACGGERAGRRRIIDVKPLKQ